ncbi:hypothetical protein BDA96_05G058900 [Sorghum bicolor]|uniref:Leucine-rich repeat-containing N-terminal plant-type domain-containing protein n=1 Tax=Sorghum bicolor TaxID=4558 RepID=A0A921QXJ5_SORBI|nr:hypothetical protein BDA96_05G058900 [Sorghum bicolor]
MKATTVGHFLLLVMTCSATAITTSSASGNETETDGLSLLDLKKSITLDPQQALASWNGSTHFCSWEGIMCTATIPRHVASIRLERRGLVGQISPSLGNFTFLRNLSLASCNQPVLRRNPCIPRPPPATPVPVPEQQHAAGEDTEFHKLFQPQGAVAAPERSCRTVSNRTVPPGLRQLQLRACASNNFVGSIPDEFARLSNMQQLYMGANQWSGGFPQAVMNLSALTDLSLGLNLLSGEVPADLGSALRNLLLLELPVNFFHGHIPPSLTNASGLSYIDISRNSFSGVVPSTIGRLKRLEMLNLEYNLLQAESKQDWEFLNSLANCTELIDFSVTRNRLWGHVPASLGSLTSQLQYLYMSENQLSGEFPSGVANLGNLFIVSLDANQFSGALPEWLGSLQNLQKVLLGSNYFSGAIPSSFSNLSQVAELYLESNRLVSQIPTSFANLSILQVLNISNNHGSIPKELFQIPTIRQISLYLNNLHGALHPAMGNARQLTYLQLPTSVKQFVWTNP